jgi:hypothetical protein
MESSDTGTWLLQFGFRLGQFVNEMHCYSVSNPRILMNRNICVKGAQEVHATHLLFIDPDMVPDYYYGKEPRAKRFFDEAWPFILKHPGSICAAPYCGPSPAKPVHVFVRGAASDQLLRVPRGMAAKLEGWSSVEAVGTGLMLIDMAIFDRLEHPYFDDEYQDITKSDIRRTQDVWFCLRAREKKIPIYVHWDCWARHYQPNMVDKPGWTEHEGPEVIVPTPLSADPSIPVCVVPQGNQR